jgi:hypothetical protein
MPRYEKLYDARAYAPNAERKRIGSLVRPTKPARDRRYRRRDELAARRAQREREAADPEPAQPRLF